MPKLLSLQALLRSLSRSTGLAALAALRLTFPPLRLPALLLALLLASGSSGALAAYNVWTGQYSFTRQELQRGLSAHFPQDLQYFELLAVHLSDPRLTLDGGKNRVITRFKARLSSPMLLPEPLNGVMVISSGLKYDAASRSVRLDRPRLEKIDVPGMPADFLAQLNMMGSTIAAQLLLDYPLYTFTSEQLRVNGQRIEPGAITVSGDTIAVDIKPLP